jgi:hypothetical protein
MSCWTHQDEAHEPFDGDDYREYVEEGEESDDRTEEELTALYGPVVDDLSR